MIRVTGMDRPSRVRMRAMTLSGMAILLICGSSGSDVATVVTSTASSEARLSRWRDVTRGAHEEDIPTSRQRAAAQGMAWGQMLDHFLHADDEKGEHIIDDIPICILPENIQRARGAAAFRMVNSDGGGGGCRSFAQ